MNRLSRTLSVTAVGLLVSGVVGATLTPTASADNSSTLTVVGTSDVFDSALIQNVIKPDFEAANSGITLNYISKGTGAAIQYAEAGSASALIVHAASLENQYVADGYSLEPYGRAIFYGDYVLLGPKSDPAKVTKGGKASDDITAAFQKVAAAGAAGKADFVSRGGTPGTTVQEHAIWATTSGVPTCTVPDTAGGGQSPYNGTGSGCAVAGTYPSWYHATGLTQGPNITNADACNYSNAGGGNDCYVFTDRGTFKYLQSQGTVNNLKIVTRSSSATAAAKANLLVNSFHAYGVNPNKFDSSTAAGINTTAATKFLNFITSPNEQAAIGSYLSSSNDPPFIPSAAPRVTTGAVPTAITGTTKVRVSGSIGNVVPGTPNLSNETVNLLADGQQIATTTTSSAGGFIFLVTPKRTADYVVSVPAITKLEYPDLDPQFSDMLAPATADLGTIVVNATAKIGKVTQKGLGGSEVTIPVVLAPAVDGDDSTLDLYTRQGTADFAKTDSASLKDGVRSFRKTYSFPEGTTDFYVVYHDPSFTDGRSATKTVTVGTANTVVK